jgi:hypothetical protein
MTRARYAVVRCGVRTDIQESLPRPAECPTDSELAAFVERQGDREEHARIEEHIHTCEACRAAVGLAVGA